MALTCTAIRALARYCREAVGDCGPPKATVREAVELTSRQRLDLAAHVSAFWGRPMDCPCSLDLKPRHGYQSRIEKDGYSHEQCIAWLAAGCADHADISADQIGRPHLRAAWRGECGEKLYDIIVPIRTTADGKVYVDDVIPKGLAPLRRN
ncbi:hypothetical protein FIV34_06320 [Luteibacter pinisoli]|uniref:Uncharacterized protein n=1 Tax=Luteibacter pinisoli TaxID=2589080 RepID=A0A4Y5Z169_9GAMM|nr:hypothetical protein [Luteibacter pinisoli]QDE38844.1 hypothetical protein FIV34_06320 [Luteibacter pinisoli]